ncbi:MAG: 3-hydroxybutyryl-CoA dehydrogenase [Rhodobacteraceae bacterium]|nr:3-hydroxybutyryl-CoA dehydrogenase [Paracoccaceae bacterium]
MDIKTVGVVGAGPMGIGIAQVFATAGFTVILFDNNRVILEAAPQKIADSLDQGIKVGALKLDDKAPALANIVLADSLPTVAASDLIVEAATEDEAVKGQIFQELVPHLLPHTILTSTTSAVSITRLASRTDRPERFMGMHFMKPVPVMKLVELIRGIATDEATFKTVEDMCITLGKTTSVSEDFPAFIVNRILMPMINEAIYAVYEGVGTVENIDKSLKLGANHPLGPLELADFIGLDIVLANLNALHDGLADNKYRPCPLLVKYVEAQWLGRKSGRGFYDYSGGTPVPTR